MGSDPPSNQYLQIDTLVLTALEHQSNQYSGPRTILHVPLNDDGSPITKHEVRLALQASKEVTRRLRKNERVLITCHMGKNRSGLITALTLINLGSSADNAVQIVRKARGQSALGNRYFYDLVQLHGTTQRQRAQELLST